LFSSSACVSLCDGSKPFAAQMCAPMCAAPTRGMALGCALRMGSSSSAQMTDKSSLNLCTSAKKSAGFAFPSMSGMFRGLFQQRSSEPKPTRASLGQESSMYYDVDKKQWCETSTKSAPSMSWQSSQIDSCENGGYASPPRMAKHAELTKCEIEQKSSSNPTAPCRMKALEDLLCLAAANGSFRPGAQSIVGVKDESISEWAAGLGTSVDVVLTALVLAYLRSEYPKEKETWALVACKSMAWLGKQEHTWKTETITNVEALISSAACKL